MEYDPISVALKFGFLAVLYLFLLVIARSALKDLRRTVSPAPDATGFHAAPAFAEAPRGADAWLVVERGGGLEAGRASTSSAASRSAARRSPTCGSTTATRPASTPGSSSAAGAIFVEDMSSTNGTLLNGATLKGEAELIDGDTVQIGDTVFRFEVG